MLRGARLPGDVGMGLWEGRSIFTAAQAPLPALLRGWRHYRLQQ